MALEIAQEQQGAVRVLALRGRLDTDTSADLELAMQDLLGAGEREFLIDLDGVSYVSSAGLRVLLGLAKKLEGSKGSMRLCALNPSVAQVFDVAGFSRLFKIFKDRGTALAGMAKAAPVPQAPSLAQRVARLLRLTDSSPVTAQATDLAREVAQLLGVKPAPMLAAAQSPGRSNVAMAPAATPTADPGKPGVLGKLRGLLGNKKQ